jgi:hypothetical protein
VVALQLQRKDDKHCSVRRPFIIPKDVDAVVVTKWGLISRGALVARVDMPHFVCEEVAGLWNHVLRMLLLL